jgi:hypothetical protein
MTMSDEDATRRGGKWLVDTKPIDKWPLPLDPADYCPTCDGTHTPQRHEYMALSVTGRLVGVDDAERAEMRRIVWDSLAHGT